MADLEKRYMYNHFKTAYRKEIQKWLDGAICSPDNQDPITLAIEPDPDYYSKERDEITPTQAHMILEIVPSKTIITIHHRV